MYGKFFSEEKIKALNDMAKEVREIDAYCNGLKNKNDLTLDQLIEWLKPLKNTHLKRLKDIHQHFEKKLKKLKGFVPDEYLWPEYLKNMEDFFTDGLKKLNDAIAMLEKDLQPDLEKDREKYDIVKGLYQNQLNTFTYYLQRDDQKRLLKKYKEKARNRYQELLVIENFNVSLLIDREGLRCTAAIPSIPLTDPIEIQINFFGTLDFASELLDMEKGGPGQESLKKYEQLLLARVDEVCAKASQQFPNRDFRLRIAGHSLGGSLAKGFAFSIQKACALYEEKPEEIMARVKTNLQAANQPIPPDEVLQTLKEELDADAARFRNYEHLAKIKGLTVYAQGSPGLSISTDQKASLLTYYHDQYFLSQYNHYHRDDKVVKFGQTEFLAGQNGIKPNVAVNKAIKYNVAVTAQEISEQRGLPFPGLTPEVMAKHVKLVSRGQWNESEISDLASADITQKTLFTKWQQVQYEAYFALGRLAAYIIKPSDEASSLYSYPDSSDNEVKPQPK